MSNMQIITSIPSMTRDAAVAILTGRTSIASNTSCPSPTPNICIVVLTIIATQTTVMVLLQISAMITANTTSHNTTTRDGPYCASHSRDYYEHLAINITAMATTSTTVTATTMISMANTTTTLSTVPTCTHITTTPTTTTIATTASIGSCLFPQECHCFYMFHVCYVDSYHQDY